ncbi:NAD(P)-dependent oxidoreductase [Spirochaetia bacterium]|nr:NAD(P)-dependent oxidoreductase [Spirochaetia bacterium]
MIWLIGNKGMLGTELSLLLEKNGMAFTGSDREVDIANPAALKDFAEKAVRPFTWIINCAAYTAVDKAEDDAETCRRLNVDGPGNIAACAKDIGARLIHISTDYVFDGTNTRPYREDDPTNPTGVYGLTKRDGELAVLEHNPRSYIIRTAWLYGKHGNNFVATMLRLMNERDEIKVVDDQRGSPTWAGDLVELLTGIIKAEHRDRKLPYGIYHYTNRGNITWFDFAREIYEDGRRLGLVTKDCGVKPCTSAEYPAKVKRPAYSVLDKTKIQAALGIDIPTWDETLIKYLRLLAQGQGLRENLLYSK